MAWYNIRYRVNGWKLVEGIYIPVQLGYGYSVLRFIDDGTYEQHEVALLKKHLSPGDRVLELGTGIGFISACCARMIGSENVHTFEGNPAMAPLIQQLYRKNNVQPQASIAMLGEKNGESSFFVNDDSFLASSREQAGPMQQKVVQERSLNEVIAALQPTYLILDIEGGEYDVFRIIDFKTIRKVQFELHPAVLTEQQAESIFSKLAANNFSQVEINGGNNYYFSRQDA
ncbi:MAG: FkbM family methyltransferase [Ferruginibacter sp.]